MKHLTTFLFFLVLLATSLHAQSYWSFEAHGGEVLNLPLPLTIRQDGFKEIQLRARFRSESFILPVYWDLRLSRWKNNKAFELEVIHHKLYLDNTTSEVQKFNISHGFNMIMVNRGIQKNKFRYRLGGGFVLAHPESMIRGKSFGDSTDDFDPGYYISGPVFNLAIGRPVDLTQHFYLDVEAKITAAYSRIRIAEGNSDMYNIAFHLVLGPGFKFCNEE